MSPNTPDARARATLALTSLGHGLCHGSKVALPMMTLTRASAELGGDVAFMGFAVTSFTMAMAASSVPAGLAGDRRGTAGVLAFNFLLTAIASAACALAPDAWSFLLAYSLLGFAAGTFHPAALGLLSLSVPGERLGRAMGTFGIAGSVGMAAMPLLMSATFGWRNGFGLLAFVAAGAWLLTRTLVRRGVLLAGVPEPEAGDAAGGFSAVSQFGLIVLLAVMGLSGFLHEGFMVLTPETVTSQAGGEIAPTVFLAIMLAITAGAQWLGGRLAREQHLAFRYAVLLLLHPLVLLAVSATLDVGSLGLALMGAFAFLNVMLQPVENRLLASFTSRARRSTGYALKFVVGLAVAAPAGKLVGELLEAPWSHVAIWRLLGGVAVLAVIGGVVFLRTGATRPRPETPS